MPPINSFKVRLRSIIVITHLADSPPGPIIFFDNSPLAADSLMLKRTKAFMHRNSSWVTLSVQNLSESSFMLKQCSYIEESFIRLLQGEQERRQGDGGVRDNNHNKDKRIVGEEEEGGAHFFFRNTEGKMRRQGRVKASWLTGEAGGS